MTDHPPGDIPDDPAALAFALFTEIGILDQLATARLERALPEGMRESHFGVLNHLARLGGAHSPHRLASAFQVSRAAMTNTLQRLEAAGWIAVAPDPDDRRGKKVSLTGEGRAARDRAMAAVAPEGRALAEAVGEARLRAALSVLRDLRERLDAARGPALSPAAPPSPRS